MLDEISEFKSKVRLYLSVLGAAASSFFSALQVSRGDHITSLISFIGCLYFLIMIYSMVQKNIYLWKGRGFLFFIPVTILNVIYLRPEYGLYWAYVGIIAFFLVMELKEATAGVMCFLIGVFILVTPNYENYILYRIYGTLILVTLFTFGFSFLIEQLHTKLNQIATHDPLTKALNRHTFTKSMEQALNEFKRYQTPATLILLDLDHFKEINDHFGHIAGDFVLKETVKQLKLRLRSTDQLYRYGGEEFAIILPQTQIETAIKVAEDLRALIERQDFSISRKVTMSLGVSETEEGDSINSWIKRCDQALYTAKQNGRNQCVPSDIKA